MSMLRAHAKLTLSLRVTGVRDDGYHLIDAEMVSLMLADAVAIDDAPATTIEVDGPFAEGVPTDASNLVVRALALAGRTARVRITKNIPNGGGLGGGSADAAAVLKWAGFTDLRAASALGADVPFCMKGGRARVTGIGEVIEPLPLLDLTVTLFVPPLHVPTPAVYRAWDAMGGGRHASGNDLTDAAVRVEPGLARWRDAITEATGQAPVLAGSGATWFLEGDHSGAAAALPGAAVITTNTRP
jgi:4-diphosphocytidyl-2-C-methyl-D-erythritol kinase